MRLFVGIGGLSLTPTFGAEANFFHGLHALQADMAGMQEDDAKKYIQTFEVRKGMGLETKFPHADAKAIDLLEQMLRLNAKVRICVTDALEHKLLDLATIRDPAVETCASKRIKLDFEDETNLDEGRASSRLL